MRYFIEEQIDLNSFYTFKSYILNIKEFSKDKLIEEFINNFKQLYPDFCEFIYERNKIYAEKLDIDELIVRVVEEKFYLFKDEEQHAKNKEIIKLIIDGKPVHNYYTNEIYQ